MDKKQVLSFVIGLLSGSIVGVVLVILLAPQSGPETRRGVTDKVNEILSAGRQAMAERRQELTREYQARIQIPLPPIESS
jgi:gas vesicle protein